MTKIIEKDMDVSMKDNDIILSIRFSKKKCCRFTRYYRSAGKKGHARTREI